MPPVGIDREINFDRRENERAAEEDEDAMEEEGGGGVMEKRGISSAFFSRGGGRHHPFSHFSMDRYNPAGKRRGPLKDLSKQAQA